MKTWNKTELIEINGKFVEKKWAFPDLEGNQTAIMLRWVNGKWETSLWGLQLMEQELWLVAGNLDGWVIVLELLDKLMN